MTTKTSKKETKTFLKILNINRQINNLNGMCIIICVDKKCPIKERNNRGNK